MLRGIICSCLIPLGPLDYQVYRFGGLLVWLHNGTLTIRKIASPHMPKLPLHKDPERQPQNTKTMKNNVPLTPCIPGGMSLPAISHEMAIILLNLMAGSWYIVPLNSFRRNNTALMWTVWMTVG